MTELPPVTCDVLQLWFTGDDFFYQQFLLTSYGKQLHVYLVYVDQQRLK